jgi:hypothetical protein
MLTGYQCLSLGTSYRPVETGLEILQPRGLVHHKIRRTGVHGDPLFTQYVVAA